MFERVQKRVKSIKMLMVRQSDIARVSRLLSLCFRWGLLFIVGVIIAIYILSEFVSIAWGHIVVAAIPFGIAYVLYRVDEQRFIGEIVNLIVLSLILLITMGVPHPLLFEGPAFVLYAIPVGIAASGLSWMAAWLWAEIVAVVVVVYASIGNMAFAHAGVGVFSMQVIAMLSGLLIHLHRDEERRLRQRIDQMQTAIEIGRMATAALEPEVIIERAVQMICSSFNYSHVGLFTVDTMNQVAILVNAAGDGAERFRQQPPRLPISSSKVVSVAIRQKQQQIITTWEKFRDVEGRAIEFTHPGLAYTRAELVIPLQVGDRILGALDLQRTDIVPFAETDIRFLQGLAGNIANALNVSYLNEQLKAENVRMEAELEVTRRLQQMLLPDKSELRYVDHLDIAGFMEPAEEIGGDYYDVIPYDGRIKIGIGDVTGHGLESGVVMLMLQTAVRTLLTSDEEDPVRFMEVLNRTLHDNIQRMHVDRSLTLALLDYQQGQVKLSGQHEQLIVVRQGGQVELQDTADLGFPLGIELDIARFVEETVIDLRPGDGLVLYSDGVTEAENVAGDLYGLSRLCAVAKQHWSQSAQLIQEAIIEDVRRFIGQQKIYDDLTLLVVKQR